MAIPTKNKQRSTTNKKSESKNATRYPHTDYPDYDEHNYNDEWDFTGKNKYSVKNEKQQTQKRREQWDQNDLQEEYGDDYASQNINEPFRNEYSGRNTSRSEGRTSERDRYDRNNSFGARNQSKTHDDVYGSQTGTKRVEEGQYVRRYGYGNDRNQPMEEFTSKLSNKHHEDWDSENSYYRSSRHRRREAEYGQEGFGDGPMKSKEEKRRLNIYNQDYRDLGRRTTGKKTGSRNENFSNSRTGRSNEYQNSRNERNQSRSRERDEYFYDREREHDDLRFERHEGHGGHGNLYGHGSSPRTTKQGHGKGGAQFSGRRPNYDQNLNEEDIAIEENYRDRNQYEPSFNRRSRNTRNSGYGRSIRGYEDRSNASEYNDFGLSYDANDDDRYEYLDAYRPIRRPRNRGDENN